MVRLGTVPGRSDEPPDVFHLLAFLTLPVFAQQASVPVIEYSSVREFYQSFPPDRYLGEMGRRGVNLKDMFLLYPRGNTTDLLMEQPLHSFWNLPLRQVHS